MERSRIHQFLITLLSLSSIGLTMESILLGWEFWVPPVIIIGTVLLWVLHISGILSEDIREIYYFVFALFTILFHGVHPTSLFDSVAVVSLAIFSFSFLDHIYMMNIFLVEYYTLFAVQILYIHRGDGLLHDKLEVSRLILHAIIIFFVYLSSIKIIQLRKTSRQSEEEKDRLLATNINDMDDFLSNISHELRTPVNVVNGMSDLLIKKGNYEEAYAIKDAGLRLTGHIDDIQDYTEVRRNDIFLEEEDYMTTSLINDVVTSFRMNHDNGDLELVVDMAVDVPMVMRGDIKKLHKIFRHLMSNAIKFTKQGGILIRLYTESKNYGVNLCIEVNDTGCGMGRRDIYMASQGMYQANKKRNRSSGGVGLGLTIVYGFIHRMGGFVKLEGVKGQGTVVKITVPQKVVDYTPALKLDENYDGDIIFHVRSDKYKNPKLRDFYRRTASNIARGMHVPLFPAETLTEVKRLMERLEVKYIFMGEEEYLENTEFFDALSRGGDVVVAVSASEGFRASENSRVIVMPKPLYAYPVIKILNEGMNAGNLELAESFERPDLNGIRALVVDDEPMNLVVATGLFRDYGIITDTANSGHEAIEKCLKEDYDVIFMDHMMPEMDGVETMKMIRSKHLGSSSTAVIVALTANVVSGAKEMFMREGFDGFIGKPININEFERSMARLLPRMRINMGGDDK